MNDFKVLFISIIPIEIGHSIAICNMLSAFLYEENETVNRSRSFISLNFSISADIIIDLYFYTIKFKLNSEKKIIDIHKFIRSYTNYSQKEPHMIYVEIIKTKDKINTLIYKDYYIKGYEYIADNSEIVGAKEAILHPINILNQLLVIDNEISDEISENLVEKFKTILCNEEESMDFSLEKLEFPVYTGEIRSFAIFKIRIITKYINVKTRIFQIWDLVKEQCNSTSMLRIYPDILDLDNTLFIEYYQEGIKHFDPTFLNPLEIIEMGERMRPDIKFPSNY
jgi:hypothetical protein